MNIEVKLNTFLVARSAGSRYASFDYCFNYFQEAREDGKVACLSDDRRLELSCLHLGFYLASWGMMRGSGELLQRSLRAFAPVVEMLAEEPETSWNLDVPAFDRFFVDGFGASTLCSGALVSIGEYYEENQSVLDDVEIHTLAFASGCYTHRCYPVAKVIDMIFFQEGLNRASPN